MFHPTFRFYKIRDDLGCPTPALSRRRSVDGGDSHLTLAEAMTRAASSQSYYTIRYLADRPLVEDAYRAYAYFRWVDDMVDQEKLNQAERLAFLTRQQEIIERCYQGQRLEGLSQEEQMAAELVYSDNAGEYSGLRTYIDKMMWVITFDARRRGALVNESELNDYSHCLAAAVTEVLHHFIGHEDYSPDDKTRYLAVTGAHITHLLRDTIEDTAAGYYNIPQEYLETHGIAPTDVNHEAFREWVKNRVKLARYYFEAGRAYLPRVENFRCRLAGFGYIGRFEIILDAIERDNYRLRPAYPERKSKKHMLKIALTALTNSMVKK